MLRVGEVSDGSNNVRICIHFRSHQRFGCVGDIVSSGFEAIKTVGTRMSVQKTSPFTRRFGFRGSRSTRVRTFHPGVATKSCSFTSSGVGARQFLGWSVTPATSGR